MRASSLQALLALLRYARGHRRHILLAATCSVLNKLFDVMPEILIGIATIKSFTAEKREAAALAAASEWYVQANRRAIAVSSAFIPIIRMAILAGFLCTFIVGGLQALDGQLNVGAYGVLVFLTQRLLWPLTDLAKTVDLYERAMASTRRILNLMTHLWRFVIPAAQRCLTLSVD